MKLTALGSAIRKILWAEVALTAVLGTSAFAQSQPAATATPSTAATAHSNGTTKTAAPAGASGTAATAPAAKSDNVQQLKRFEVTGSLIRSADKVGFNQVQTVKAKDIEDSGYTNVSDYLRSVSANSANSWSEGQSSTFAPGAAGIALRGLSEKYTLVLVDGQRVAPYGFVSNGTDTFFDLNTLPLNIIDRIEIVKTGAVSQYGSDAIAGVVNIITKHNFRGLELDGSYGGATQGGEGTTKFSVLGGFGDLNADRFNVTAAASYYKANGFTLADRDTTKGQDFTNQPGGLSQLSPAFWNPSPITGNPQALSGCPFSGSVQPAGTNWAAQSPGTVCAFNSAQSMSIAPQTERLSTKVHADFKLTDTTTAFADVWVARNSTTANIGTGTVGSVPGALPSPVVWNPTTGMLSPFSTTVPGQYNPFGVATPLVYSFPNAISDKAVSTYWRASTGVKGSFSLPRGDWDWSLAYSHSQSIVADTRSNLLNASVLNNIFQNGTLNFANPSATPNAFNGLYASATNEAISKLDAVDATLSTPNLFHLPAGDVGLGLGAQFLHQSEFIGQGADYLDGSVINPNLQHVDGSRNVAAAYYQVDIPIIHNLTFSQSGRYDHYSDFGGAFSPRFALRYQPVQMLTMYGSYNRGFRAPTLVEDTPSTTIGLSPLPNGSLVNSITSGNPNVQPERTRNLNVGFQLSPTRTTDVGFDWYRIHIDHVIGAPTAASVIAAGNPSQIIRNPDGSVAVVYMPYQNLGSLETSGFEGTFRQALPTTYGTFTLSADWAYVNHFKFQVPGVGTVDSAGNNLSLQETFGGSFPRWKGTTSLEWAYRKFDATLSWDYTGPYTQALGTAGAAASIPSYSQFDLYMSYTGFKHWTLYAGVNNIFNRAPPFDSNFQNGVSQNGYDQSLYMYYGRFGQVGATYKF